MIGGLAVRALVVLAIVAAGFAAGWSVNGWRLGAQIAVLEANQEKLLGANARCSAAVDEANAAMKSLEDAARKRQEAAAEALRKAEAEAARHKKRAADLLRGKPVAPGKECEAIADEILDYKRNRK